MYTKIYSTKETYRMFEHYFFDICSMMCYIAKGKIRNFS